MGGSEIDPRTFGALEATVKHLIEQIEKLDERISGLERSLANMTTVLDKVRGGWRVLVGLIAAPSFILGLVSAVQLFR